MKRDDQFLKREYWKILFPIMFSVLGGTINALIDSMFVTRRLGSAGLSAVNLAMPVYLALCTAGSLVGYGASFYSAKEAGRERMEQARRAYHSGVTLCLLLSVLFTACGLAILRPLSAFLAPEGVIRAYVRDYCGMTLAFSAVFIIPYMPMNYLQLEGRRHAITNMIIMMVFTDAVLDYVFLYMLDLGARGAALASVVAMLFCSAYGFLALEKNESDYRFHLKEMNVSCFREIVRLGSPAALANLNDAARLLFLNMIILNMCGQEAAAKWAVLNTLSELSLIVVTGVPRAGAPMMGVYHSARENSGLRLLMRIEVEIGAWMSLAFAAALVLLHKPVASFFSLEGSMLMPLCCLGVSVICSIFSSILEAFFNAAGRITLTNVMVVLRRLALPVALAILLSETGEKVWLFLPLASMLALLLSLGLVLGISSRSNRSAKPLSTILLLDDSLERENKVLDFSIPPDMGAVCEASERIQDFCRANAMGGKQTIQLGLAIEELLGVLIGKLPNLHSVDLRAFAAEGVTGLRIRCTGVKYNPFEDSDSDEDFLMGIVMLHKMAQVVTHSYTLGMNTINILFDVR